MLSLFETFPPEATSVIVWCHRVTPASPLPQVQANTSRSKQ